MSDNVNRRDFLKTTAAGATALTLAASTYNKVYGANDRIGVAFVGVGGRDLICRCGQSILVKGYLPANFLAIRIKCFRCGAITATPALAEGEILSRSAVGIERNEVPAVVPARVPRGGSPERKERSGRHGR